MGDSLAPSSPLLVAQKPAVPLPAASPAQPAMAAPPSSIARPPAPASASLRPQNERLAPPSVAKRPKTTTPRAACYVFGESNPWMASSASRAAACSEARAASANSPFTSFAASLTPLYPNAVQAALPTPLAQLVHEGASERRGAPCDSSAPKPKRVVTFSREQLSAPANDLGSALGELSELVSQLERPEDEQHVARVDSAQQLSGGGHATHTPFAEPCLADWGREGDAPDSLARVLSIQPTQRGLSPLSADVDAECVRNHQMVHKRRLQFDCDKMLNANRAATMTPSSTPVRTPARGGATDEHWLVFREGGSLGTPLASCSPSLPMLGTPNSLKEAFRFSEGLAGWKGKGQPLATTPGGTSHAAAGEDSPLAAAPSSAAAGASAAAKAKRERGKENSSKGKPRTCNCKHSKCIKLYCDCFSAGQFCLPSCKCANCLNNADNEPAREEARRGILERNQHAFVSKEGAHTKGCNCKNSKCMKKYCECYQAGVSCSERCKCVDCSNGKPHVDEGEGTPAPAPAGGVEREDDCSPMELMLALRSGGVASPQCALVRAPSPRAAVLPAAPAAEAAPGALAGPVPRTKAVTALSAMLAPMAAGTSAHSTSLRAATAGPGLASPASAARAPARAAEVSAGAHAQGKPAPSCPALARAEGSTSGALMTTDALVETLADAPPRKRALGVQCEHSAAASLAAVAAK